MTDHNPPHGTDFDRKVAQIAARLGMAEVMVRSVFDEYEALSRELHCG